MAEKNAATEKLVRDARTSVHKLAGLLTGASAGLFHAQALDDADSIRDCLDKLTSLLDEAQVELVKVQSALRELDDQTGGPPQ